MGFHIVILTIFLWWLPASAFASSQETQLVVNALKQAERGNISQAKATVSKSSNPAAQSLIAWYDYTQGDTKDSFQQIASFVSNHSDWPLLDKIRLEAEKKLNESVSDQKVIQWFSQNQPVTANATDRYVRALLANRKISEAKKILRTWWPKADLTRDQQRSFYARYSHYLDKESHEERLRHLLHRDQFTNAEAIANVLGGGYPVLTRALKSLSQKNSDVNNLIEAVPAALKNDEGLLYERLKWRRQNDLDQGAIEILNKAPSASRMHVPADWWRERHIIVRRLIEKKQYKQAYELASSHRQKEGFPLAQAEWVSGWLALQFVNEPWKAFEHFEKLYKNVESPISKARASYWAGRASEALKHPEIATQWYNVGARYPETFYGQLSAEKINRHASLERDEIISISTSQKQRFKSNQLVQSAKWLDAAAMQKQSALFLLRLSTNASDVADYVQVAALADDLGQRHMAIKVAQKLQKEKGISQNKYLYPSMVRELKNIYDTEWAFINAIIRQESRFDVTAYSHAGARGLMQLMPATAKEVASRNGYAHQTSWLTSRPAHNIKLGARYLTQMVDRFKGNYAMAAAAYNAGPNRVDRWVKEFGDPRKREIDLIDWIELIPIYETRNYVQRVLEGVYVYRDELKNQQRPFNDPIHVAIK